MPTTNVSINSFVVANWGLAGAATKGRHGYRSQNPWQALEHYMEGRRGNGASFLASHGATPIRIDSGGSVWKIELVPSQTLASTYVSQFAKQLLDNLVQQNTDPQPGDYICITYYDANGGGRWEWTP